MSARYVELTGGAPWGFRMHGGVDQNQPLRISRVNPGRKAALGGIREGDVISSIDGQPTARMTNSEAHAALRSAGDLLTLGLNEDRRSSPDKKSIRRTGIELKRPSELIAEVQGSKITPQAPVYATIRASPRRTNHSPKFAVAPSIGVTNVDKSTRSYDSATYASNNPFYSTLPTCYTPSSVTKANGSSNFSSNKLRINKSKTKSSNYNVNGDVEYDRYNQGPNSLPFDDFGSTHTKCHDYKVDKDDSKDFSNSNPFRSHTSSSRFGGSKVIENQYKIPKSSSNPFFNNLSAVNTKSVINGPVKAENRQLGSNIREEINRTTITKHEFKEYEEVKTIKKIVLNGSPKDTYSCDSLALDPVTHMTNGRVSIKPSPASPRPSPSQPATPSSAPCKPVWQPSGAGSGSGSEGGLAASGEGPAPPPPPPNPLWSSPQPSKKTFLKSNELHGSISNQLQAQVNGVREGVDCEEGAGVGKRVHGGLRSSHSAPSGVLSAPPAPTRLPKAQNPTVTLLQKARNGQLPRGSNYLQEQDPRLPRDRFTPPSDPVHALRREYASEGEDREPVYRRMAQVSTSNHSTPTLKKVDGIGPTTKEGMPIALRSEVKDQSKWYKKMYDTIHKNKYDDDYVTVRYKSPKGDPLSRPSSNRSQYAYFDTRSGYLSEPEGGMGGSGGRTSAADSDSGIYSRRRTTSAHDEAYSPYLPNTKYSTLASARASQEIYKNQPGRIENYLPGKSSVIEKESKQWWDEVMDIFDGWLDENSPLPPYGTLLAHAHAHAQALRANAHESSSQPSPRERKGREVTSSILSTSNMHKALKESGYESDSQLVFRRRGGAEAPLSPEQRRAAYRDLQAGGEPPLKGFRSPAPHRQDEEIEYIPLSPTLTKIRVHKTRPKETVLSSRFKKQAPSYISIDISSRHTNPPAPPRRVSSKNNRTLKLVTSIRPASKSPPKRGPNIYEQSNVDFLREKINKKLTRQGTQILSKGKDKPGSTKNLRQMSSSAPPAVNRRVALSQIESAKRVSGNRSEIKSLGTSSFMATGRTVSPVYYNFKGQSSSYERIPIEGGAGRKTPISHILDRVTSLDKLWGSNKGDIPQANLNNTRKNVPCTKNHKNTTTISKSSSMFRSTTNVAQTSKSLLTSESKKYVSCASLQRGRDMLRSSDKLARTSKFQTKSYLPITAPSNSSISGVKPLVINHPKKKNGKDIKTAVITSLKTKQAKTNSKYTTSNKSSKSSNPKTNVKIERPKKEKRQNFESEFGDHFEDYNELLGDEKSHIWINPEVRSCEIQSKHRALNSDSFFQHLFLRGMSPNKSLNTPMNTRNSMVLEKAKLFQSYPQQFNLPKTVNTYLIHRKPVSMSRFKVWDKFPNPTPPKSPRSVSWPGRIHDGIRKFDSLKSSEFGSTLSLATVRSRSEPPNTIMFFSQTTRPISPTIIYHKKSCNKSFATSTTRSNSSPPKLVFSQTSRPVSPKVSHKILQKSFEIRDESPSPTRIVLSQTVRHASPPLKTIFKVPEIKTHHKERSVIVFSQTCRPISPVVTKKINKSVSRSESTSPISSRSPSYRKIHSARLKNVTVACQKTARTRSADDIENERTARITSLKSQSFPKLTSDDPEYDEYINDIKNEMPRSDRFKELNRYYSYLERVGELERTTSNSDLRHRKKDEEIIDFDRWKKIRSIERAEEELNKLYTKLKQAQVENDVLFYPKDVNDFRWNYNKERGLKIKEKSVENLKEHFQQVLEPSTDSLTTVNLLPLKDTYKPLWRSNSVADTVSHLNKKDGNILSRNDITKPIFFNKDSSLSDLRKRLGLESRLWSSLSMEQVNALKNQLNAIYSKDLDIKSQKVFDTEKYAIDVPENITRENSPLHVRSNSLTTEFFDSLENKMIARSDSIAAIEYPTPSVKDIKNNVNKIQMSLSEIDKKRISQTLSKEVLDRVKKIEKKHVYTTSPNNEASNDFASNPILKKNNDDCQKQSDIVQKNESVNEKNTRHIIFPPTKTKEANQIPSSASETETGSSDVSKNTVIYRGPSEVQKKVNYFESVQSTYGQASTVYHARENSDEKLQDGERLKEKSKENEQLQNDDKVLCERTFLKPKIIQSQSCTNLKELFGETEKSIFSSLPPKGRYSRSPSPRSEAFRSRTPDTVYYSSEGEDSEFRSRSASPDLERYWRAYLNIVRAGEVKRLARRFECSGTLRRHRSDPEIARNVLKRHWPTIKRVTGDVDRLTHVYEQRGRGRRDRSSPVARVPLRSHNRYMPHIDIISKLAALRRRTTPRSRSAGAECGGALECRPGEVDRIRRRFETMSLLGQVYASAPDVHELRDIAPHLTASWIAHRYPAPEQNSVKLPLHENNFKIQDKGRVKPRPAVKLGQSGSLQFDPALHRPVSRYTPPRPPRPAALQPPLKHSVKFKESGRRYVESDVNIHYRCPVSRDPLPLVPEQELARRQAEHMKQLYREQRRAKYLQDINPTQIDAFDESIKELQDIQNRRHTDNFTPGQKTVIPPNRYEGAGGGRATTGRARALFPFAGQGPRELTFSKGDFITVRRQIDANWYEGELNGRIGLFPYNYVEMLKSEAPSSRASLVEGRARAKYEFKAQTGVELGLRKGELVTLTRRIDANWWEGRVANRKGIFPHSYVDVIQEPSKSSTHHEESSAKPVASPAAHGLMNGSARASLGAHSYTPQLNSPALSNAPQPTQPLTGYGSNERPKAVNSGWSPSQTMSRDGYGPPSTPGTDLNNTEPLYIDTNAEAVPYRAMYRYVPQHGDELELAEGDVVYVVERCSDGWYVGSSQRTARLGTFPGNYVTRIA